MKFEIVDFYPSTEPKKNMYGTMHVYIIDYQMDFRGILVKNGLNGIFFQLPGMTVLDENRQKVFFPFIDFTDQEKKKELINFLKTEGKQYLKEKFKDIYGRMHKGKPFEFTQKARYIHQRPKAPGA